MEGERRRVAGEEGRGDGDGCEEHMNTAQHTTHECTHTHTFVLSMVMLANAIVRSPHFCLFSRWYSSNCVKITIMDIIIDSFTNYK